MLGQTRLDELGARKKLLLVEANAYRQLIALDAQYSAHALRWLDSVHHAWQHIKPLAWMAAPAAGFYLTRHGRSVWRWVLRLGSIWRSVSGIRQAFF